MGPEHPRLEQYAIDIMSHLSTKRVLEIGYQSGGFAIPVICRYANEPGFSYHGIDNGAYSNAVPQENIEKYLHAQEIHRGFVFARGDAAQEMRRLWGKQFDLVLIDHLKTLYARELLSLLSRDLLADTAYILLHDVLSKGDQFWQDCQAICEAFGLRWEIVDTVPGGLAVIRYERPSKGRQGGWRLMALRARLLRKAVRRRAEILVHQARSSRLMNAGPGAVMKNALRCTVQPPYSRLYVINDGANWVLKNEASELCGIAHELGIPAVVQQHSLGIFNQALMFTSNSSCQRYLSWKLPSAVGVAWYHGRPCAEFPEFKAPLDKLRSHHQALARVQVSHTEMRDIILQTGIAPHKVHLIPIGINLRYFTMKNQERCREVRTKYGIPTSAVVVGSFQKDGNGWGEGLSPKLIKGPDIFVAVLDRLLERRHDLHVLLTGPARGYVKQRLSELGIPFTHLYISDYAQVGELYQALDLYLVTSRQEGGPKAILESMASGIPLITTRVGQAMDLVRHGENGWMTEVEDVEALAHWAQYVIEHQASLDAVLRNGRMTAQQHSYVSQVPLWRAFFSGMVRERN